MKIDVEGAEFGVLNGAVSVLRKAKPTIFLATHGEQVRKDCCELLESIGYALQYLAHDEIIARFPCEESRPAHTGTKRPMNTL